MCLCACLRLYERVNGVKRGNVVAISRVHEWDPIEAIAAMIAALLQRVRLFVQLVRVRVL